MNFDKLKERCQGKTLLGVGPVSKNTIDVTINLANKYDIPIILIPSRRQVECQELGGGYVDNTKDFVKYVKSKDLKENIIIARDHGSVWQGNNEENLSRDKAVDSALVSYGQDIWCGFDILHIDPSLKKRPLEEIQLDVEAFYDLCEDTCEELFGEYAPDLIYEVGTEEHSGGLTDIKQFETFAKRMSKLSKVKFIVGNTGTYVRELSNTGNFDQKLVKDMLKICEDNGLWFKEHNLDYTDESVLALHPQLGIHSANVAPEFGTVETTALLNALYKNGMEKWGNDVINIAIQSNKWRKWMKSDTVVSTDYYIAQVCGHYVFNNPEVLKIKEEAQKRFDLNKTLTDAIESSILKYLRNFGWVK